jgi:hypothetical protein
MEADGNCLYRALSDQLFYDYGNAHSDVRNDICDYMEAHEQEFHAFLSLDEDQEDDDDGSNFESYLYNMRKDGEWGGHVELVAASRLYQ